MKHRNQLPRRGLRYDDDDDDDELEPVSLHGRGLKDNYTLSSSHDNQESEVAAADIVKSPHLKATHNASITTITNQLQLPQSPSIPPPSSMTTLQRPRALFLASLGNPGSKYRHTPHSAGHTLISALATHLSPDSSLHSSGSSSVCEVYLPKSHTRLTLWQSPSLMNISGPTLVRAYKTWLAQNHAPLVLQSGSGSKKASAILSLILLHDELQQPPGKLQLRVGGAELSDRGHNGVKSVVETLVNNGHLYLSRNKNGAGGQKAKTDPDAPALMRIGVGIGRPVSREPDVVADYVLAKMSSVQVARMEALAGPLVDVLEREVGKMVVPGPVN
ncbi:hypothetical protein AJ80_09801 [Polytolypa hystricis UAMH7299]|uniref:peptidyl-tRNA hydrolase n=1 Tax=Polytolypa hystricis (strain UAMH7299) TaxID=1447883 RepID=A0A2B7WJ10_POLH7|nr:hypothetical protein AJ80_09801 [Polytolypa hystricis UAMH7299]